MNKGLLRLAMVGVCVVGAMPPGSAVLVPFANIDTVVNDYAPQLSVEVEAWGIGEVSFTFVNSGPVDGRIKGISIQDLSESLGKLTIVDAPPAVDFALGVGANIPASIAFDERFDFRVDGGASRGVDPGESLVLRFGADYADVLAGLESGALGFGLHVGSIDVPRKSGGKDSQKFLSGRPIPGDSETVPRLADGGNMMLLLGAGILGLVAASTRLRRAAAVPDRS